MLELCDTCVDTRDHPHYRFPTHLVHPEHHKRMVWSVTSEALCPHCGALWRFTQANRAELI